MSTERALAVALSLNAAFLVVEAAAGFITGSLALLSDAAHMLGDVAALGLALAAAIVAKKAGGLAQTYGLRRVEVLGAFVNGLLLLAAAGWIVLEAIERLVTGIPEVAGLPILVVGVAGLVVNLGSAAVLMKREGLNVRAAMLHMLTDALGSIGAIVAALAVLRGYQFADAAVSLLIAVLVVAATWRLLADSTRILLQFAPAGTDVDAIRADLEDLPGVAGLHDFHVWTLDGTEPIVSVHVVVEPGTHPYELHAAALDLLAQDHSICQATVQVETSAQSVS
ncbi:MAG TPA: cation diffusion facilitator family transporter [Myxococcota bacterium]|nr:cation diffusion facilitator family transporter [Myxococcota bacterium]